MTKESYCHEVRSPTYLIQPRPTLFGLGLNTGGGRVKTRLTDRTLMNSLCSRFVTNDDRDDR
jgi:hypothetical protein